MMHRSSVAWLRGMLLCLIAIIMLMGCQSSTAPQPTPSLVASAAPTPLAAWTQAWLSSTPCRAPCWYGITPGQTSISDALRIVRSLPFVDSSSIQRYGQGSYTGWQWQWTPPIGGRGEVMGYADDLHYIALDVDEEIRLAHLIAQMGPPRVYPRQLQIEGNQPIYYEIIFLWPEYGISDLSVSTITTPPPLQPQQPIKNSLRLYPITLMGHQRTIPWSGYHSFFDYEREYTRGQ